MIVARGLGRSDVGSLVAVGLGRRLVEIPITLIPDRFSGGDDSTQDAVHELEAWLQTVQKNAEGKYPRLQKERLNETLSVQTDRAISAAEYAQSLPEVLDSFLVLPPSLQTAKVSAVQIDARQGISAQALALILAIAEAD